MKFLRMTHDFWVNGQLGSERKRNLKMHGVARSFLFPELDGEHREVDKSSRMIVMERCLSADSCRTSHTKQAAACDSEFFFIKSSGGR